MAMPSCYAIVHDNQPTSAKCLEVEVETWREVLFFHQIAWHPKVRDRSSEIEREREREIDRESSLYLANREQIHASPLDMAAAARNSS